MRPEGGHGLSLLRTRLISNKHYKEYKEREKKGREERREKGKEGDERRRNIARQ